jgi:pimeloyl-ACP methyl ester carboxylesterase
MLADTLDFGVEPDVDLRGQQRREVWWTCDVLAMPETRYARNGLVSIAYQVFGEGPITLVVAPPGATNCEVFWEDPRFRRMFAGFASFCRFVHFDKRGTGLSDRAIEIGSFDERVDDMKAVLDDAGIEQSYVMGLSEGGPMAIVFAATYPERTLGLILASTTPCLVAGPDDDLWDPVPDEWSTAWSERWGHSGDRLAGTTRTVACRG